MEYRRLGKSGLKLSELSFGSWVTFGNQVQGNDALDLMAMAYDAGINFFDNAEIYESGRSEVVMGEALRKLGWSRDTYLVSSKVFRGGEKPTQNGLSRKHVFDACHAALKRLQVDYLDLYYCHRPDVDTPIEETVRAMHNLITQGKVIYWGTSEWTSQQLTEAYAIARQEHLTPPTMEQPEYNLFRREKVEAEFMPLYRLFGLGTTIWSPLASGILTGKYNDGIPADSRMNLPGYEWLKARLDSDKGGDELAIVAGVATEAGDGETVVAGAAEDAQAAVGRLRPAHGQVIVVAQHDRQDGRLRAVGGDHRRGERDGGQLRVDRRRDGDGVGL